jgi:hypothetical protein
VLITPPPDAVLITPPPARVPPPDDTALITPPPAPRPPSVRDEALLDRQLEELKARLRAEGRLPG